MSKTIFRIACKHKPYSQLGNAMLRDKRLSIEARGVLAFILSHPADWRFSLEWLAREVAVGRQKAQRLVRELVEAGYCSRSQQRDGRGRLSLIEYEFSDEPDAVSPQVEIQPTDTQHLVSPQVDLPPAGLPPAVNHPTAIYKDNKKGQSQRRVKTKEDSAGEVLASPRTDKGPEDFEPSVLRELAALSVDTAALIDKYNSKTRVKHIADPSAYLLRMGREEAANRHGVTSEHIAAQTSRNRRVRVAAAVDALGARRPTQLDDILRRAQRRPA